MQTERHEDDDDDDDEVQYDSETTCAFCHEGVESGLRLSRCSGCYVVKYCCREHQVEHYKTHKKTCKIFRSLNSTPEISAAMDRGGLAGIGLTLGSIKLQMSLFPAPC